MSGGALALALLVVCLGGAAGSVARWGLREGFTHLAATHRPQRTEAARTWSTFVANVLACFLMGIVVAQLGSSSGGAQVAYLALAVGFCGGLSTLSTAAMDLVEVWRRSGFSLALAYLLLSMGGGMAALWIGLVLAS